MNRFFSILVILVFIAAIGCSSASKIDALKPEPDDASPLLYDTAESFINMPVSIRIKDVENKVNSLMSGLIYEDNNIADDNYEVKIWKLAPITLTNENGRLRTILPLKALVKYRIGTNALGMNLYNTKEFNFNGNVTLLSTVTLTNWQLKTATDLKSLVWNESPTVTVLGRAVPITYVIDPAIKLFRSRIEKSIDDAIAKSMDFKPNVLDALAKMSAPFEMSQQYESWLRVVPLELYSTEASLQKDRIAFEMGLKCNMETLIGQKPEAKFDRPKIILKPVSKMPDHITANIAAVSTYADASKIMSRNFAGQEFGSGSKKIKVTQVELWHKSHKMIIALDVTGALNGRLYLSGVPQYSEADKEIYFDDLEYVLDTKSKLVRSANWLLQGYVLNKMKQACRYSIKPNLDEARASLTPYLKNYSPMPGVFVNGNVDDISFGKIQLTNRAMIAFVRVNGKMDLVIDGLK